MHHPLPFGRAHRILADHEVGEQLLIVQHLLESVGGLSGNAPFSGAVDKVVRAVGRRQEPDKTTLNHSVEITSPLRDQSRS